MAYVPGFAAAALLLAATVLVTPVTASTSLDMIRLNRKCPACIVFANALRKVTYDTNPPFTVTDAKKRRKQLVADDRIMDTIAESIDVVLSNFMTVLVGQDGKPARVVPFSPAWGDDAENDMLQYGMTFWPARSMRAFGWLSPDSIEAHERKKRSGGDNDLLNFINGDLYTEFEERVEEMTTSDFLSLNNETGEVEWDRYVAPPAGLDGGRDLFTDGKRNENRPLRIFVNSTTDSQSRASWAYHLCPAYCGKNFSEWPTRSFPVEPQTPEEEALTVAKQEEKRKAAAAEKGEAAAAEAEKAEYAKDNSEKEFGEL